MLKKILLASAIATLTSNVIAGVPAPYVGAGIGINTNTSSSVTTSSVPVPVNPPGNFRGVPFQVFAGYGGQINQNFYLAGEVFWKVATAEISNNSGLRTSYGYGASIMPGVMLCDNTFAFVRAGVIRDHFSNADSTRTGGQLGLGLQTNVTQNIDVRGEYDYTAYGSFNNTIGRVASPTTDSFNVALIYKFD